MRNRLALAAATAFGLVTVALPAPAWAAEAEFLDSSFGKNGDVLTDFGGENAANAMALQTDGMVVVAGYARSGSYDFALARYTTDGNLDSTFGRSGKVVTDIGGANGQDFANAVAVQADGKIVVAGSANSGGLTRLAVARYNADGSLDTAFGRGGTVLTDVSGAGRFSAAYAVAIESNGDIVAAGPADGSSGTDFGVVRYSPDGSVDGTFGDDGTVRTNFGGGDFARSVVVCSDGAIVVAGDSSAGGGNDIAVARYRSDGSLDANFADDGTVLTDINDAKSFDEGRAVALQPDGAILVAGSSNVGGSRDFALVRYQSDGSLDSTFGADGSVLTDITGPGRFDAALAVALTPDNKIVTAGAAGLQRNTNVAAVRYQADGSLDTSFGRDGVAVADLSGVTDTDAALAVVVRPDRRIVVAGSAKQHEQTDFAVAQFLG